DQDDVGALARRQRADLVGQPERGGTAHGGPVHYLLGAQLVVHHGLTAAVRFQVLPGPVRGERGSHRREEIGELLVCESGANAWRRFRAVTFRRSSRNPSASTSAAGNSAVFVSCRHKT